MTLKQFRSLQLDLQEKLLVRNGAFLFERKSAGIKVLLYQLNNFYVEVFYDTGSSKVCLLKTFTDPDGLEAYLSEIDLAEIKDILNKV
jgi:hypothetical protein